MATDLIQVLKRKLVAYEGAGMTDQAAAVKAKLAAVRSASKKTAAKAEAAEPVAKDEPAAKPKKET